MRSLLVLLVLTVLFLGAAQAPLQAQARVDVAIVLAVDASASVDPREFKLQMQGIADAIRDPQIIKAINSGAHGAIALSIVQWSSLDEQAVMLPWTLIANARAAQNAAARAARSPRVFGFRGTAIADAIRFSTALMGQLPVQADRLVIDISGDGKNNHPPLLKLVRQAAVSQGITINGLPIISDDPSIHFYYNDAVIGGPGAFIEIAYDFDNFAAAMKRKLLREIRGPVVSLRRD